MASSGPSSPPPMLAAAFIAFLFCLSTASAASASPAPAALDQVCGRLGGYYVTPTLCISTLCSTSPSSSCHTLPDAASVAALAARLAADNATAARDSIQAALTSSSSSPSPPATGTTSSSAAASAASAAAAAARSACLQLYAGAVPALRWAAKAVAEGRYRGAREVLQAAQYVAAGCEGMAGDEAADVLPRENGRFGDMAFVAHAVVASMAAD